MDQKLKKNISLIAALSLLGVIAACGAKSEIITGTIEKATPSPVANRIEVLVKLEGRPETFLVHLSDIHKFGMTTIGKISSGPDLSKSIQDLEATKGWKVKLTCEKTNNPQGPEYLVKTLEKLPGK